MAGSSPTPPGPTPTPVFYDRLVFDGTAYIETDVIPPVNASLRTTVGYETLKAPQRVFQCQAANSTVIGINYNSDTNTRYRYFGVYYGDTSAVSATHRLDFSTDWFSLWLTPNRIGAYSYVYSFTKGPNAAIGPLMIGTNVSHTGQPFTGRMSRFIIYGSDAQNVAQTSDFNNYTPLYTFKPCTYNGEAGMWCIETSRFYGNTAGSGTLTVLNDE